MSSIGSGEVLVVGGSLWGDRGAPETHSRCQSESAGSRGGGGRRRSGDAEPIAQPFLDAIEETGGVPITGRGAGAEADLGGEVDAEIELGGALHDGVLPGAGGIVLKGQGEGEPDELGGDEVAGGNGQRAMVDLGQEEDERRSEGEGDLGGKGEGGRGKTRGETLAGVGVAGHEVDRPRVSGAEVNRNDEGSARQAARNEDPLDPLRRRRDDDVRPSLVGSKEQAAERRRGNDVDALKR